MTDVTLGGLNELLYAATKDKMIFISSLPDPSSPTVIKPEAFRIPVADVRKLMAAGPYAAPPAGHPMYKAARVGTEPLYILGSADLKGEIGINLFRTTADTYKFYVAGGDYFYTGSISPGWATAGYNFFNAAVFSTGKIWQTVPITGKIAPFNKTLLAIGADLSNDASKYEELDIFLSAERDVKIEAARLDLSKSANIKFAASGQTYENPPWAGSGGTVHWGDVKADDYKFSISDLKPPTPQLGNFRLESYYNPTGTNDSAVSEENLNSIVEDSEVNIKGTHLELEVPSLGDYETGFIGGGITFDKEIESSRPITRAIVSADVLEIHTDDNEHVLGQPPNSVDIVSAKLNLTEVDNITFRDQTEVPAQTYTNPPWSGGSQPVGKTAIVEGAGVTIQAFYPLDAMDHLVMKNNAIQIKAELIEIYDSKIDVYMDEFGASGVPEDHITFHMPEGRSILLAPYYHKHLDRIYHGLNFLMDFSYTEPASPWTVTGSNTFEFGDEGVYLGYYGKKTWVGIEDYVVNRTVIETLPNAVDFSAYSELFPVGGPNARSDSSIIVNANMEGVYDLPCCISNIILQTSENPVASPTRNYVKLDTDEIILDSKAIRIQNGASMDADHTFTIGSYGTLVNHPDAREDGVRIRSNTWSIDTTFRGGFGYISTDVPPVEDATVEMRQRHIYEAGTITMNTGNVFIGGSSYDSAPNLTLGSDWGNNTWSWGTIKTYSNYFEMSTVGFQIYAPESIGVWEQDTEEQSMNVGNKENPISIMEVKGHDTALNDYWQNKTYTVDLPANTLIVGSRNLGIPQENYVPIDSGDRNWLRFDADKTYDRVLEKQFSAELTERPYKVGISDLPPFEKVNETSSGFLPKTPGWYNIKCCLTYISGNPSGTIYNRDQTSLKLVTFPIYYEHFPNDYVVIFESWMEARGPRVHMVDYTVYFSEADVIATNYKYIGFQLHRLPDGFAQGFYGNMQLSITRVI